MFGSVQSGANAYAKVGMETGVIAANPHKLIVMLFEGAQIALNNALQHMHAGNIPERGKALSKAIAIIENGLRASLDKTVGGQLVLNLDALYEYMNTQLLLANLNNQPELIQEVQALLHDIQGAWEEIAPKSAASTPVATLAEQTSSASYDALAPTTPRLMKA
ncbi:flagellar export chaperone FliS [Herminiimonas fonticola]|uniref:Flagellar protein FliS n=1 Tax=Herminiimonas fonticola TaxID=303380 RepID=A0A4R6GJ65_9BURK|nr:flagellar export chaperone FliS [Herminiimonas fonticola]RBA25809.1 fliS: flagellar protein FliS [Herminiimonas fonticola]TDN94917.1 flagellar protein FliS [Herminiimonas fonticola]